MVHGLTNDQIKWLCLLLVLEQLRGEYVSLTHELHLKKADHWIYKRVRLNIGQHKCSGYTVIKITWFQNK